MAGQTKTQQRLLGITLLAAAVAVITYSVWSPRARLVARWQADMPALAGAQAAIRLHQAAKLGTAGLPLLVTALHHQDQSVVEAALDLLRREIDRWQKLPAEEATPLAVRLASALARQSRTPGPFAGHAYRQLLEPLVRFPLDRQLADRRQFQADCETILRVGESRPRRRETSPLLLADASAQPSLAIPAIADEEPLSNAAPSGSDAARVGPAAPSVPGSNTRAIVVPEELDPPIEPDSSARVALEPPPLQSLPTDAAPRGGSDNLRRDPAAWLPALNPTATDAPPRPPKAIAPGLQELPTLDLIRRLSDAEAGMRGAARQELRRRGFQPLDFRLAEMLLDERLEVRLELARELPQLPGVDARPWLIWLSRDPDAQVRRAAVGILATSRDPALQSHLRGLEREETDEEVQRVVRRAISASKTAR